MLGRRFALLLVAASLGALACGSARLSATSAAATPPAPTRTRAPVEQLASSPHVRFGIPLDVDPSDDYLVERGVYVASYNSDRGTPNWVAWRLTREDLGRAARSEDFRADERLPAELRHVPPSDYRASGLDRGHLCPSAHRTHDAAANSATFLMTNVMPQAHALNAGPWQGIEAYERELAERGHDAYVVAGGLFGATPPRIGHGVAVPRASFRVTIVVEHGQGPADVSMTTPVLAVEMPNDDSARGHRWDQFRVSVDQVERDSGYDVLSALPDVLEALLEAEPPSG